MRSEKSTFLSFIICVYIVLYLLKFLHFGPFLDLTIQYFRESSASPHVTLEASLACQALDVKLPGKLSKSWDKRYQQEQKIYWSKACSDAKPACILFPRSKEDVATAVLVLKDHDKVKFVIKSGGHSPNVGHSSIAGGVLIAMSELRGTAYDEKTQLARVRPGGTWARVVKQLETVERTVVSGRVGMFVHVHVQVKRSRLMRQVRLELVVS
jgi:FAD binding domain